MAERQGGRKVPLRVLDGSGGTDSQQRQSGAKSPRYFNGDGDGLDRDGMKDGMGWDGMGWDRIGWDGMGWDGME